ncbi:MAG: hypothetical protein IBGAMO2_360056 [Arenicellales bacterium IbO2]|nr:MAG: hypothetical protein IBGAMO2_360056 [Arenicellales bacterium IbO2]
MGGKKKEIQLNAVVLNAAEGGYVSFNPETGTASQGETIEEAVAMLREATELIIEESPGECPRGETVGVGMIKPMMVSVDESILCEEMREGGGQNGGVEGNPDLVKGATLIFALRQAKVSRKEFLNACKEVEAEEEGV